MQGFESSDIYWIPEISKTRPMMNLRIEGKQFRGLVGTLERVLVLSAKNSGLQVGPGQKLWALLGAGSGAEFLMTPDVVPQC